MSQCKGLEQRRLGQPRWYSVFIANGQHKRADLACLGGQLGKPCSLCTSRCLLLLLELAQVPRIAGITTQLQLLFLER